MQKSLKEFILMTVGVLVYSIGVYIFKIPNGFSTGGVSGAATILGKLTTVSPATWISIMNILLLIVGFLFLGKSVGVKTTYCSLLFSVTTWGLERIIALDSPISTQPFMELVYAILLTSVGSALLFYCDTSSGGIDMVALILKKYTQMDVGKALLCTNSIIVAGTFFVFDIETGLFSVLGLLIHSLLVDNVIEKMYALKYFMVITEYGEEISEYIMGILHHGVTTNVAQGAFTGSNKTMIHTVCKPMEAIKLRTHIKEIDPQAFIIITTSSEIFGREFRSA